MHDSNLEVAEIVEKANQQIKKVEDDLMEKLARTPDRELWREYITEAFAEVRTITLKTKSTVKHAKQIAERQGVTQ